MFISQVTFVEYIYESTFNFFLIASAFSCPAYISVSCAKQSGQIISKNLQESNLE